MTLAIFILAAAIIGTLAVVGSWVYVFPPPLSTDPNTWGAFGSYVGGTLSAYIAALALVAFLRTISQQQIQIEQLRKDAAKVDLVKAIEKTERDYEETLKNHAVVVDINGATYTYSALDVVSKIVFPGYEQAMFNQSDMEALLQNQAGVLLDDHRLRAMETFSSAAGHLNQLRIYVLKHDEIANNNVLSKYYQRKYRLAFKRFVERSFFTETWEMKG